VPAERVRRALVGRLGPVEDRLAAEVEEVFRTAVEVPAGELPAWAETGIIDPAGRRVFGKHTLGLDAAELADGIAWPPITVTVIQVSGAPACCSKSAQVGCHTASSLSRLVESARRSSPPPTWRGG
jgi:hypothetical protein